MKIVVAVLVSSLFAVSAFAAGKTNQKRSPASSDMCFDTAERVAMFAFQETDGGYGFSPFPGATTPSTTANPDGSYNFGFGAGSAAKADPSRPSYTLSFHLNSKSQACELIGFAIKHP